MSIRVVCLCLLGWIPLLGCSGDDEGDTQLPNETATPTHIDLPEVRPGVGGELSVQGAGNVRFTIDLGSPKQSIEHFGASDAWSIQYVGLWDSAPEIAELLFSTELDSQSNPLGIGLSLWRFNIGAGSSEQNNIADSWRRSESFLKADGSYDWTRQQGQQEFMQLAKSYGVEHFVGFANSPPVYLTANGNAFGNGGGSSNLPNANVGRYAQYLADVWKYFADPRGPGIAFDYLSPVNEPQWDWAQSNGQEGNPYTNSEIAELVRVLDRTITDEGLAVKIEVPEAAQLNFFYEDRDQRGYQLDAFFGSDSPLQISQLDSVAPKIAGHSYFTTWPVSTLISTRQTLAQEMRQYPNISFWMSEYCVLEDNTEVAGSRDVGSIDPALYTARVIHHDLSIANANSWQWWLAVSPYNYNDGLVFVSKNESQGYQSSKTLWALGQFSRFVRPGMQRLETLRDDQISLQAQAESLMASSYYDPIGQRLVMVLVNYAYQAQTIDIELLGEKQSPEQWVPYVTSDQDNMSAYRGVAAGSAIRVPSRSIVTLVADGVEASRDESLLYFVNAGHSGPSPAMGTMNSVADQSFAQDSQSGMSWGYDSSPTWVQSDSEDVWNSLRTDEQDVSGRGLSYRFELPDLGAYKVLVGMFDPWGNSERILDVRINGQVVKQEFTVQGQMVVTENFSSREELHVEVLRGSGNSGSDNDPLLNWIRVYRQD